MINDDMVEAISKSLNNAQAFSDYKKKLEVHEEPLNKLFSESSSRLATDETLKIMQILNTQATPEMVYEQVRTVLTQKMHACFIAGFIANEVAQGEDWESRVGVKGRDIQEKKLKAFIDGKLADSYYEGIKPENELMKLALENFDKRKERDKAINELVEKEKRNRESG